MIVAGGIDELLALALIAMVESERVRVLLEALGRRKFRKVTRALRDAQHGSRAVVQVADLKPALAGRRISKRQAAVQLAVDVKPMLAAVIDAGDVIALQAMRRPRDVNQWKHPARFEPGPTPVIRFREMQVRLIADAENPRVDGAFLAGLEIAFHRIRAFGRQLE